MAEATVLAPPPDASADALRDAVAAGADLPAPTVLAPPDRTVLMPALPAAGAGQLLSPGDLINNNYRVVKLISSGGMGEVYRGANQFTGDPVAIKVILPELARDPAVVALFKREARILGQLGDNAIVRYHNFIHDPVLNRYCLVMEHVEGRSLLDRVRNDGPLSLRDARFLMRRLASGLARVHQHNVIHRDLSPDNVILRNNRVDEAVLIDFGIARSLSAGDGLGGRFAGKYHYIAPEQLGHFDGRIDARTDIYGLALMMVAALRGGPPPMGGSAPEAARQRRHIPDLSGIEPRLTPLLQYMLEPDPADRPVSMQAVIAMLDDPGRVPLLYRVPQWQTATAHGAAAPGAGPVPRTLRDGALTHGAAAVLPRPARQRRAWPLWLGLGLAALGMAAWYGLRLSVMPAADDLAVAAAQAESARDWPARDLLSRDGFLAAHPLPGCSLAARITTGPEAGQIGLLADGPRDTGPLLDAYEARFGLRPGIAAHRLAAAQCPVIDLLHLLSGRHFLPPLVALDGMPRADNIAGTVTQVSGMPLWLFLVSPAGDVYDLTPSAELYLDGSYRFRIAVQAQAAPVLAGPGQDPARTYLLVALASERGLAHAAAAVPGTPARQLMPLIRDELADMNGAAAADFVVFQVNDAGGGQP